MNRVFLLSLLMIAFSRLAAAPVEVKKQTALSVVRVNVTNQAYDFVRPWSKKAPYSRRALGALLANKRVLVTAELVANATYVELEKAESGEKVPASVEVVDYEANLALLRPSDDAFLKDLKPLELGSAAVGDRLSVWQLESTGTLLSTPAQLTTVEVARYPVDDSVLLTYRLTSSLQYRESSFTLPIVKGDKLIGMLMRYDNRTQNVDAIPAPVITHFLNDAADGTYSGFPRAGFMFSPMRDPQFRHYVGLDGAEKSRGVYVTQVTEGSPAQAAGVQVGDVILAIGDAAIDQDGNYADPQYGKVSMIHLISTKTYDGETLRCRVFRKGITLEIPIRVEHRILDSYLVEPYTIDEAPPYYVIGGLVLQELTRQYLKEWGSEWQKKAPERFVYIDRFQSELPREGRKNIVILTQVLPSPATVGYEGNSNMVVTKINDVPLKSFADVGAAVEKPINGFHKIEFEDNPKTIYLDAKQVSDGNADLLKSYRLPAIKRLN
jgi:hypothetical protein